MSPADPAPATLLLASGNAAKREELRRLLGVTGRRLLTLADHPGLPEAPEEGDTFLENARAKALHYAAWTGLFCVADDSGLEVDALAGAPGVRSARFAGPGATDQENNELLLHKLEGVPEERRGARFRCAVALAREGAVLFVAEGTTEGTILAEPKGRGGFGYDPLFLSRELGRSFGTASPREKDRVSHRGRALEQLVTFLKERRDLS